MTSLINQRVLRTIPLLITIFSLNLPAYAQYSGGTGEPNDPYQIATAEDLMLLGETPEDYDKHFILTTDIDLDPNLPGRKVFDRAVIAPDTDPNDKYSDFQGTPFTGVFDGNGHTISHLTITGGGYLGLFGLLHGDVTNLGVADVNITGSGHYVGGLACSGGNIAMSYSTGSVTGNETVGGLTGSGGSIATSYSTVTVTGNYYVGGLVGNTWGGSITTSYSNGRVSGVRGVGGLVGVNSWGGSIATSYSTGAVTGEEYVGGLVGSSVHIGFGGPAGSGSTTTSFWNIETSGQTNSAGGTGLITAEMQDINTYLNVGWDFVDEILNGTCDYWQISPGDYPLLRYHAGESPLMPEGFGTAQQPYLIRDVQDLGTVWFKPQAHYRLVTSLDLSGITWSMAVIPRFGGTFDGNDYVISNLHIQGGGYLGLFGRLDSGAMILNLGMDAVDVNGIGDYVGGAVGYNDGNIYTSYSTGTVSGGSNVGGLVGSNLGSLTHSYSAGTVTGNSDVGGLVGVNAFGGSITLSYSNGTVTGHRDIGGLVGNNMGSVINSYSTGATSGFAEIGGLVGYNVHGSIVASFWDMETSGQTTGARGTGKTTAEMQTASTFYAWACGDERIWTIDEGRDYPRLWWENKPGELITSIFLSDFLLGSGMKDDPFLIYTAEELNLIGLAVCDWGKDFRLMTDIDMSGFDGKEGRPSFNIIGTRDSPFGGVFDGKGHTISHLTIEGKSFLGLFGFLGDGAEVKDVGMVNVNINGSGGYVGGFVAYNEGDIHNCYSTGSVSGDSVVGGLVGANGGSIATSYSSGMVSGNESIGGLVGYNEGSIDTSYSIGAVSGTSGTHWSVGGLVGQNDHGSITMSFWDKQTSGRSMSNGGIGKTTAEMQTASTFNAWACGDERIWTIDEGNDYPRLWWENKPGELITSIFLSDFLLGSGMKDDPFLIYTAEELNLIGLAVCDWGKDFRLMTDIDMSGFDGKEGRPSFNIVGTRDSPFGGVFDGNGHTISHLVIESGDYLGLVGYLGNGAKVKDLGVVVVKITGSGWGVGGLVGYNSGGTVTNCYSTGTVEGEGGIGGLVGTNGRWGSVSNCYSTATVTGNEDVGGLVGYNGGHCSVTTSCSTGKVTGSNHVGGLVGLNQWGSITASYSSGTVSGSESVGGLVGENYYGSITTSYSTGTVTGNVYVGGLVGSNDYFGDITTSFWDIEISGLANMCGNQGYEAAGCDDSYGKITTEMKAASTFLNAGWDFVDETENGTDDIWWILEGQDYPRLWWEDSDL